MKINNAVVVQKILAFGVHFLFSLAVVAIYFLILRVFWYPDFLFEIDGGVQGLAIVFLVDVVLGPLLTFIIYKKGKKGLLFDLSVVVALQFVCLIWGVLQTYQQRPLLIVLVEDSFHTLNQGALDFHQIPTSALEQFPGDLPKVVYAPPLMKLDKTPTEQLKDILNDGPDYSRYKNYKSISQASGYLLKYGAITAESLKNQSSSNQRARMETPLAQPEKLFFNIDGTFKDGIVEVETTTGLLLSFQEK